MNQTVPKEVGTYNFEEEVVNYPDAVMVLVSSNNCQACKEFTNVFFEGFKTHAKYFKFCILDSDRSPEIAMDVADGNYPSTAVYYKGKLTMTMVGALNLEYFRGFLNRQISAISRRRYEEQQKTLF